MPTRYYNNTERSISIGPPRRKPVILKPGEYLEGDSFYDRFTKPDGTGLLIKMEVPPSKAVEVPEEAVEVSESPEVPEEVAEEPEVVEEPESEPEPPSDPDEDVVEEVKEEDSEEEELLEAIFGPGETVEELADQYEQELKYTELVDLAKERGVSYSGRKAEIAERLARDELE